MEILIGTSGWNYSWNPKRNLEWYVENTPFNAIEVNSTFYHFPKEKTVENWLKYRDKLKFVVKVHRSITHLHRFNEKSKENWKKFYELLRPLTPFIDLFLFQIPPSMKSENLENIISFHKFTEIGEKFAFEPRRIDWFKSEVIDRLKENNITLVSVSAPRLPDSIIVTTSNAYIRFHGRTKWYSYRYSEEELIEYSKKIKELNVNRIYIFFNNDYMLENCLFFYRLLFS